MRTTLDIDDAVLDVAREIARERGISVGAAVSLLAHRGLQPRISEEREGSLHIPVFTVEPGAGAITPEHVRSALDED
jgi:hypothetical protein